MPTIGTQPGENAVSRSLSYAALPRAAGLLKLTGSLTKLTDWTSAG